MLLVGGLVGGVGVWVVWVRPHLGVQRVGDLKRQRREQGGGGGSVKFLAFSSVVGWGGVVMGLGRLGLPRLVGTAYSSIVSSLFPALYCPMAHTGSSV